MSRHDVERLILSKPAVAQTLYDFKAKKLNKIGRKRIDIIDSAGLEAIAKETL